MNRRKSFGKQKLSENTEASKRWEEREKGSAGAMATAKTRSVMVGSFSSPWTSRGPLVICPNCRHRMTNPLRSQIQPIPNETNSKAKGFLKAEHLHCKIGKENVGHNKYKCIMFCNIVLRINL